MGLKDGKAVSDDVRVLGRLDLSQTGLEKEALAYQGLDCPCSRRPGLLQGPGYGRPAFNGASPEYPELRALADMDAAHQEEYFRVSQAAAYC